MPNTPTSLNDMPDEIKQHVASFLAIDPAQVARLALVSKSMHVAVRSAEEHTNPNRSEVFNILKTCHQENIELTAEQKKVVDEFVKGLVGDEFTGEVKIFMANGPWGAMIELDYNTIQIIDVASLNYLIKHTELHALLSEAGRTTLLLAASALNYKKSVINMFANPLFDCVSNEYKSDIAAKFGLIQYMDCFPKPLCIAAKYKQDEAVKLMYPLFRESTAKVWEVSPEKLIECAHRGLITAGFSRIKLLGLRASLHVTEAVDKVASKLSIRK